MSRLLLVQIATLPPNLLSKKYLMPQAPNTLVAQQLLAVVAFSLLWPRNLLLHPHAAVEAVAVISIPWLDHSCVRMLQKTQMSTKMGGALMRPQSFEHNLRKSNLPINPRR